MHRRRLTNMMPHSQEHKTLSDARPGKKYRIVNVRGGCKMNSRLCAMGLMPGEDFSVYAYSKGGPVCISVKGSRFAIGRGMMGKVQIEEA